MKDGGGNNKHFPELLQNMFWRWVARIASVVTILGLPVLLWEYQGHGALKIFELINEALFIVCIGCFAFFSVIFYVAHKKIPPVSKSQMPNDTARPDPDLPELRPKLASVLQAIAFYVRRVLVTIIPLFSSYRYRNRQHLQDKLYDHPRIVAALGSVPSDRVVIVQKLISRRLSALFAETEHLWYYQLADAIWLLILPLALIRDAVYLFLDPLGALATCFF